MKPSKHTAAEPTGRMVDNNGHWEYRYDDPAMNAPPPIIVDPPRPRSLRSVGSTSSPLPPVDPDPMPAGEAVCDNPEPLATLRARHDGWTAVRQCSS